MYVGRSGVEAGVVLRTCVSTTLGLARAALPRRVAAQCWIRYHIDLTEALPPVSPDVRLTRVTDDFIDMLRHHPEQAENQVRSALRFWDRGLRRAYVWLGDEGPLCMQWLLTEADGRHFHRLGEWAGMYPPLAPRTGQVENLFAFATVRKQGVATQIEYALYREARRLGLTQLVTHIYEPNSAARAWADRTGWRRCGTITRYQVDLPGLRSRTVFVHRRDGLSRPAARTPGVSPRVSHTRPVFR